MIVDAHLHIFTEVNGLSPHGPVCSDAYGRVRVGGQTRPFLPAYFKQTAFDADSATALLDEMGVERAVLMQNAFIGIRNEEIAAAIERSEGRFRGALQADPVSPQAVHVLEQFAERTGMKILKLELSEGWGWTGIYPDLQVGGAEIARLWKAAAKKGMSVLVDPGPPLGRGYDVEAIERLAREHCDTPLVIDHLGYLTREMADSPRHLARWRQMWGLARLPNVYLGLSAAASLLGEPYPCPKTCALVGEVCDEVGAEKLLWGTDAPLTLNLYTYAQMCDMLCTRVGLFSQDELELIMGGNASRLWWGD